MLSVASRGQQSEDEREQGPSPQLDPAERNDASNGPHALGAELWTAAGCLFATLSLLVIDFRPPVVLAQWFVGTIATAASLGMAHAFRRGELVSRPVGLAVRAGLIYWFFWPALSIALGKENAFSRAPFVYEYARYTTTTQDSIEALALILYFMVAFLLMERVFAPTRDSPALLLHGSAASFAPRRLATLSLLAIGFGFLLYLLMAGGNPARLLQLVLAGRGGDTPWRASGLYGSSLTTARNFAIGLMIGGAASALVISTLHRPSLSARQRRMVVAVPLLAIAMVVAESGTRNQLALGIVPMLLAALTVPHAGLRDSVVESGRRRRVAAYILLTSMCLLFVSGQVRSFRNDNTIDAPGITESIDTNDNDFFSATMVATGLTRTTGSRLESPVALAVIQIVPNALWPGTKPYSPSTVRFTVAKWGADPRLGRNQAFGSLVGQYYMAFGVPGPGIAATLYAALARFADGRARRAKYLHSPVPFALAAFLFVSYRGLFGAFAIALLATVGIALAARERHSITRDAKPALSRGRHRHVHGPPRVDGVTGG